MNLKSDSLSDQVHCLDVERPKSQLSQTNRNQHQHQHRIRFKSSRV